MHLFPRKYKDRWPRVNVPETIDVKMIRTSMRLTQKEFAEAFGFSPSAVRQWEQGVRTPERPIRVLLQVIAASPETVIQAAQAH